MFLYKNKIVVTGGSGRFGSELKKVRNKYKVIFPTKNELNILKLNSINRYLKKHKPKYLLHLAGLSRPMKIHEKYLKHENIISIRSTYHLDAKDPITSQDQHLFQNIFFHEDLHILRTTEAILFTTYFDYLVKIDFNESIGFTIRSCLLLQHQHTDSYHHHKEH